MHRIVGGYAPLVAVGSIASEQTEQGVALVEVKGEHDLYTAADLREELQRAMGDCAAVVVDLSDTTFIDSSVVGALLDARNSASDSGTGFAVCLGSSAVGSVRRIFDITGLIESLPVLGSRDEAVSRALGKPE
jgi:anti-sigma B factor antagonist